MSIKILSNNTINKIAAGEVIERPASVVKELVENSIDAKATQIDIILECAGKNLIVVKDDGMGMSKEELSLAIQRHATSKLDEDNLLNINSFGFRGEALPSIGAISKFKITSRLRGAEQAYSLSIIGGKTESAQLASCNIGTIIEVRDLFFATPARLKFLRTDRTELTSIINYVKKVALAHHMVGFSLRHNNREILKVRAQSESGIKNRVLEMMGREFIENSTQISLVQNNVKIHGYTTIPTHNRASADEQYLFINNRPVKDKILNIALKVSYQDYLARDRHPTSILFLSLSPEQVDVNVHPAKSEVRFHDPNLIRRVVTDAIKNALYGMNNKVSTAPAQAALRYMQNNINYSSGCVTEGKGANFTNTKTYKTSTPTVRADYAMSQSSIDEVTNNTLVRTAPQADVSQDQEVNQNDINFPLGAAKAQLYNTYIVSQSHDSMIITDQHAAHERIGYEKIKKQIEQEGLIKQRLLIPEIIDLLDESKSSILGNRKELLSKLGLTLEIFGQTSIIVSEIPSLVGEINVSNLISDLSDYFSSIDEEIALTELVEHVTETYACYYAIRAGRKLNIVEMNNLLRQMENTPFSGQCNHGRQTYIELKLKDIEKLFGRR